MNKKNKKSSNIHFGILILITFYQLNLYSQNQWQSLNGPYGGNISSIFQDSSGNIWITSPDPEKGLYKFDLQSFSLESINKNLAARELNSDSFGNLYLATYSGIYKSTDSGNSWFAINNGIPNDWSYKRIKKLLITHNDIIFATTDEMGLFRSTDLGATWILINNGLEWKSINSICSDSLNNIYLATWEEYYNEHSDHYFKYGIFKSSNNGENWILIKETGTHINSIVCDRLNNLFAGLLSGGVIKSSDQGLNWINQGLEQMRIYSLEVSENNQLYSGVWNGNPFSTDSVAIVYKLNENLGWEKIFPNSEYVYANSPVKVLKSISDDLLLIGTDIFSAGLKADGVFLLNINECVSGSIGIPQEINSIHSISDSIIYSTMDQGLFKFNTNNNQWLKLNSNSGKIVSNSFGELFLYGNGVIKSTNDGSSWSNIFNGNVYFLVIDSSNNMLVRSGRTLYRSTNFGESWETVNTPNNFYLSQAAINDSLIIITNEYILGPLLYRSFDYGINWEPSNYNQNPMWKILISPNNNIFGLSSSGFFKSIDDGMNWMFIADPTPSPHCFGADKNNNIYFGSEIGVTKIDTQNDTIYHFGLNDIPIYDIHCSQNNLFAGGGEGVFIKQLLTNIVDTIVNFSPEIYTLYQNYPNPFNSSTTINFRLKIPEFITLKIFNYLGEELTVLVNEFVESGEHNIIFESKNYSSGVYFYQLKAGSYLNTKKMILLK